MTWDKLDLEKAVKELGYSFLKERKPWIYKNILNIVEKGLVEMALERTFGNQCKAARILGINRNTLRAKMRKFGIKVEEWKV